MRPIRDIELAVTLAVVLLVVQFYDTPKILLAIAAIVILGLARGVPEAIRLRSEHSTADREMDS